MEHCPQYCYSVLFLQGVFEVHPRYSVLERDWSCAFSAGKLVDPENIGKQSTALERQKPEMVASRSVNSVVLKVSPRHFGLQGSAAVETGVRSAAQLKGPIFQAR